MREDRSKEARTYRIICRIQHAINRTDYSTLPFSIQLLKELFDSEFLQSKDSEALEKEALL